MLELPATRMSNQIRRSSLHSMLECECVMCIAFRLQDEPFDLLARGPLYSSFSIGFFTACELVSQPSQSVRLHCSCIAGTWGPVPGHI